MLADDNEMRAAVAAAGEEVRLLFSCAGLLSFVTDAPDAAMLQYVQEMARRVSAFVSRATFGAGGLPTTVLASPSAVAPLVASASEVASILAFLSNSGRSLKLLELSGICGPVAQLSMLDHQALSSWPPAEQQLLQQVRSQAAALAGTWWDLASAADNLVEAALAAPGDVRGGGGGGGARGGGGMMTPTMGSQGGAAAAAAGLLGQI